MTSSDRDALRALGALVGVVVSIIGLTCVASVWHVLHPGTSREARGREAALLAAPVGDPTRAGLTPMGERSSAGEEASGFMAESPDPVSVSRWYRYAGEPLAACEAATAELVAAGWTSGEYDEPCTPTDGGVSYDARSSLSYRCSTFDVSALVTVDELSHDGTPKTLHITLTAPYPERSAPRDPGADLAAQEPPATCE